MASFEVSAATLLFELAVLLVLVAVGLILYFALRRRRNLPLDTTQSNPLVISWRGIIVGAVVALVVYGLLQVTVPGPLFAILISTGLWDPTVPAAIASLILSNVVTALSGFGALLLGGYLAGRRAGRRGGTHGLAVSGGFFLLKTVVGMVFGVLFLIVARMLSGQTEPPQSGTSSIDPASLNFEGILLVGAAGQLVFLLLIFVGGYLGGRLGERHASLESPR